jgi:hypothetical protein
MATAEVAPIKGETDWSAGHTMTGGIISSIVTENEQELCRCVFEIAVQVTNVVLEPENWVPDGGLHVKLPIPELPAAIAL